MCGTNIYIYIQYIYIVSYIVSYIYTIIKLCNDVPQNGDSNEIDVGDVHRPFQGPVYDVFSWEYIMINLWDTLW